MTEDIVRFIVGPVDMICYKGVESSLDTFLLALKRAREERKIGEPMYANGLRKYEVAGGRLTAEEASLVDKYMQGNADLLRRLRKSA